MLKSIIFNTHDVQAITDKRKSTTRLVIKPQPPKTTHLQCTDGKWSWAFWEDSDKHWLKAPYDPGDILYVRETFAEFLSLWDASKIYYYKANGEPIVRIFDDNEKLLEDQTIHWKSPVQMPKSAARIFLRVTGVRVERLQDITDEQAVSEGCQGVFSGDGSTVGSGWDVTPTDIYKKLWDNNINPADRAVYGWAANPWVWVVEFKCISKEEAQSNV